MTESDSILKFATRENTAKKYWVSKQNVAPEMESPSVKPVQPVQPVRPVIPYPVQILLIDRVDEEMNSSLSQIPNLRG